jgi:hypothetical protein
MDEEQWSASILMDEHELLALLSFKIKEKKNCTFV